MCACRDVLVNVVTRRAVVHLAHVDPKAIASLQIEGVRTCTFDHHLVELSDSAQCAATHIGPQLAVSTDGGGVNEVHACHIVHIQGLECERVGRCVSAQMDALDVVDSAGAVIRCATGVADGC